MVNPVLDDKDRVLGKTEKGKEQFGGIEDRIFARGQEAGKTAIVKELLAIGDLSLEKISRISGVSMEELHRIQALSKPR